MPSLQQQAEEPCQAMCPLCPGVLMLLSGGTNPDFSYPSSSVLVCCPARQRVPKPPAPELVTSRRTWPQSGLGKGARRRGPGQGRGNAPSPPCSANRNPKGPNSKVLIQAPGGGVGTVTCGRDRWPWHGAWQHPGRLEGCGDAPAGTAGRTSACRIPELAARLRRAAAGWHGVGWQGVTKHPPLQMTPPQRAAAGMAPPP